LPGPWLAFLRYLGAGVEIDLRAFEARLVAEDLLSERAGEAGFIQSVLVADLERIGLAMLAENPWAFVARPAAVHIDAPGALLQPDGQWPATRFVLASKPERREPATDANAWAKPSGTD
jgi:hypothetical protein